MSNPLTGLSEGRKTQVMDLIRKLRREQVAETSPLEARKMDLRDQLRALSSKKKAPVLPIETLSLLPRLRLEQTLVPPLKPAPYVRTSQEGQPPAEDFGCAHGPTACAECLKGD